MQLFFFSWGGYVTFFYNEAILYEILCKLTHAIHLSVLVKVVILFHLFLDEVISIFFILYTNASS